ncbi:hypothetical protein [Methylocaldum sp.]|uniref:hypothetical protein n=1 Tax=Methylocaldum sp. TaxID=1969727 RepID=UPI002D3E50B8|nr:hypothetical protein [Methylocaldum sp.]HYE36012.1 hypothetical protein [Methylocaldum sp.]
MSDSNPPPVPEARRSFIRKMMALAGGLFGSAALQRAARAEPIGASQNPVVESGKKGYRETEHVRAYYDAARF